MRIKTPGTFENANPRSKERPSHSRLSDATVLTRLGMVTLHRKVVENWAPTLCPWWLAGQSCRGKQLYLQRKRHISREGCFRGGTCKTGHLCLFFLRKSTAMLLSETHIHAYGLTLASFQGCVREKQPGINYLTIPRKTRNSIVSNTHLQYNSLHHQKIDVLWGLLVEITKISTSHLLLSNCFVAASFSAIYVY